jgi:hypothetical protein
MDSLILPCGISWLHLIAKMVPGSYTLQLFSVPQCQDLLNYICYFSEDHCWNISVLEDERFARCGPETMKKEEIRGAWCDAMKV